MFRSLPLSALALALGCMIACGGAQSQGPSAVAASEYASEEPVDLSGVLQLIPADMTFTLIIPSMGRLDARLAELNERLGTNVPGFGSFLLWLRTEEIWLRGADEDAPFAVMVADVTSVWYDDSPDILVLVPVADWDQFQEGLAASGAGPLLSGQLVDGTELFFRRIGDFALIGEDEGTVGLFSEAPSPNLAVGLSELSIETLSRSEISISVHLGPLADWVDVWFDTVIDAIGWWGIPGLTGYGYDEYGYGYDPYGYGSFGPEQQLIASVFRRATRGLIRGTDSFVAGIDLGPRGVEMLSTLAFSEGSALRTIFSTGQGTDPVLATLPDLPFLSSFALDVTSLDLEAIADAAQASLIPEEVYFWDHLVLLLRTLDLSTSVAGSWRPNGGLVGQNGFTLTVGSNDPNGLRAAIEHQFDVLGEFEIPQTLIPTSYGAPVGFDTTYEVDSLSLNGVSVDRVHNTLTGAEAIIDDWYWNSMIASSEQTAFVATTDSHVVLSVPAEERLLGQALESADGSSAFADRLSAHRRSLGNTQPFFESFFDLNQLTEMRLSGRNAKDPSPSTSAAIPPMSLSLSSDGESLAGQFFLPTEVLRILFAEQTYGEPLY